jgi:regulator of replication initiation timing
MGCSPPAELEHNMRIPVSSHCLLIALAIAALVTSVLHIDRLQRRIDVLRSENENLNNENGKLKTELQKSENIILKMSERTFAQWMKPPKDDK